MLYKYTKRPNIVFILSDDHGQWALGCSGNKEIRTPNLDKLAAEGIRFENFFCTSPVCSPARASLLTGKIPSQHGVHDWLRSGNIDISDLPSDVRNKPIYKEESKPIEYLEGQTAYTDILCSNGYICGISGKWHLGDSIKPQKSFSHWFVHQKGGGPYNNAPMVRDGKLVNESGYITDIITDDAISFIEQSAENSSPFYISINYTAPHAPWVNNHPPDIVASYDECLFESCPQQNRHPWTKTGKYYDGRFEENARENLKGYFAAVTAMDENIGRLIGILERLGIRENTLVCFMGDNGHNCGHHGIWGKGNGTFPMNMYDTSVKVPAIFNHPGLIPQGLVCDELLSGYDFMPTLLDYVSLNNPEAGKLPGKSFLSLLLGSQTEGRENVVVYDEYGPVRMIRNKKWKYIHRYPYGPHELYDLVNDPGEINNLIKDTNQHDVLECMRTQLEEWFLRYTDPEFDGSRKPVTGAGQVAFDGCKGKGVLAFKHDRIEDISSVKIF